MVAELEQREQRLYGLVESTVADEKETEHQIQSREARIEALEAALRARDRQLDALIAQSLERSGIALMGPAIGAAADAEALDTALDTALGPADVVGGGAGTARAPYRASMFNLGTLAAVDEAPYRASEEARLERVALGRAAGRPARRADGKGSKAKASAEAGAAAGAAAYIVSKRAATVAASISHARAPAATAAGLVAEGGDEDWGRAEVTQLVLELGQARQALVEANAKVDAAEVRRNSRSLEITRDHSRSCLPDWPMIASDCRGLHHDCTKFADCL